MSVVTPITIEVGQYNKIIHKNTAALILDGIIGESSEKGDI